MSHMPKIPKEQRSFADAGGRDASEIDTHEAADPNDKAARGDRNLDQQGRSGNMRQNLTPQWKTQDR